ncbi:MAG: F0F1 ATP synthase subunit B [Candidatus Didemnitutus sp.]|nr:F0F1 ATP synthase subunit B [Candidatus Didemnitutus sp.]
MLPLLIAATEASAQGGIVEQFGIQPKYVVMQVISFLILFVVLYKFGIKPTIATMDERNKKIESGLQHAVEMQAKLAAAAQESAQLVKNAQVESQKLIDEARRIAKDYADKQQAEALQRSADLIAKAQQASELEHRKMLDLARGEIARLVVTTTERVLAKQLTDADRAAYNAAATKELSIL